MPLKEIKKTQLYKKNTSDEVVYFNSFFYFLNLIRELKNSKSKVDISIYIFEDDRIGQLICSHLLNAAIRGVEVRIIIDGFGSRNSYSALKKKLKHPKISIRTYNPLPWPLSTLYFSDHLKNKLISPFLNKINHRNHTKIILIDNKTLIFGSFNFFDPARFWRETGVLLKHYSQINQLNNFYDWLWNRSFFNKKPLFFKKINLNKPSDLFYFSFPRHARKSFRNATITKVQNSNQKVQIVMPYFYPPLKLIKDLCKASQRGVLVEIILPNKTDTIFFPRMSRIFYKTLLASKVQIYEYQTKMIHAKQFMVDDWVMIGSSNLNSRSLFLDLEFDYVISDIKNVQKIAAQFTLDKKNSTHINSIHVDTIVDKFFNLLIRIFLGNSI
jgi:cardiolipin synthase A/B